MMFHISFIYYVILLYIININIHIKLLFILLINEVILDVDTFNPDNIISTKCKNNVKQNSYFKNYLLDRTFLKNIYFSLYQNPTFKEQYLKTIIYFNEKTVC